MNHEIMKIRTASSPRPLGVIASGSFSLRKCPRTGYVAQNHSNDLTWTHAYALERCAQCAKQPDQLCEKQVTAHLVGIRTNFNSSFELGPLRKGDAGGGDDARHAENLGVLFVRDR